MQLSYSYAIRDKKEPGGTNRTDAGRFGGGAEGSEPLTS